MVIAPIAYRHTHHVQLFQVRRAAVVRLDQRSAVVEYREHDHAQREHVAVRTAIGRQLDFWS